jgi:hypothetical protein
MIGKGEDVGARGEELSAVLCLPLQPRQRRRSWRYLQQIGAQPSASGGQLARGRTVGVRSDFTVGGADGSGVAAVNWPGAVEAWGAEPSGE